MTRWGGIRSWGSVGGVFSPAADEGCDGSADLNAFAVLRSGEDAGIWLAIRSGFAGAVFVAVQVVDEYLLEGLQVVVAHGGVREAVQRCVVGDDADDAET